MFERLLEKLRSLKSTFGTNLLKRLAWFFTGLGLLATFNSLFDWVLYPVVMFWAGSLSGAIIMALLSVPCNLGLIWGYDKLGQDLFGFEALKEIKVLQSSEQDTWIRRILRWVVGRGRIGTFILIAIYDPIPATIFMRHRDRMFRGLQGEDWKWFVISTIIANLVWAVPMTIGVEGVRLIQSHV